MKLIRWILGKIILMMDALIPVKVEVQRSPQEQVRVDAAVSSLKLYQFAACPFCVKVRRAARKLGLSLETRDALRNEKDRQELIEKGGKAKVPCLRITAHGQDTWMYESSAIIAYLTEQYGQPSAAA